MTAPEQYVVAIDDAVLEDLDLRLRRARFPRDLDNGDWSYGTNGDYLRDWFPVMALLGLGGGLAFPSLGIVAMAGTTPSDAGLASGLLNTTGQVGAALGLAVLATVSTNRTTELIRQGQSTVAALSSGFRLAWAIGAVLAIASIVLAATLLKSETAASTVSPREEEAEEACG